MSAPSLDLSRCRSCGAPIVWAKTKAGKIMPIDVDPQEPAGDYTLKHYPDGNLALQRLNGAWSVIATTTEERHALDPRSYVNGLYKTHFATCPNAAAHRKPRS